MTMKRFIGVTGVVLCLATASAMAQLPEDALRFATPGFGVGARALGMGNAYTGVASDFSAIYWNPAGLAQLVHGEFSLGLNYNDHQDNSTFFGNQESYSTNATNLNTFGVVYPLPVQRGNATLAFGFTRQNSFLTGMSFKGFNPNSTIAQWYAPDGWYDPNDPSYNLAYMLYLADTNATGQYVSPIKNRLTQLGTVIEGGGLNNWSAAGGFDLSKNFSVGVTLTYLSGSYRYDRSYREEDSQHLYSNLPLANYKNFQALAIDDYIDDDVSGWNAMLGLMYRVPDKFRFGMTIKTPTALTIHEKYGTTGHSYFNDGPVTEFTSDARNDYDITTPWVFGAGMSVILRDLILSADIDYTDWTTLEFTNASADLIAENKDIKTLFHGTANLRGGAEYEFTSIGLRLRGGFIYNPSPFRGDPGSFAQKVVTGGLGILLGESTMIDLAYAHGWRDSFIYNYDASSRVDEKIATNTVLLTLTHRF